MSPGGRARLTAGGWVLGLPAAVLATVLAAHVVPGLPVVVLVLCVVAWSLRFGRAARNGEARRRLAARAFGLTLAVAALAAWPPVSLDARRDDALEAVLRFELQEVSEPCTYYLEVDGEDPDPALLARLRDLGIRVEPRSACEAGLEIGGVRDRRTGESGAILHVSGLRRSLANPGAVAVDGGYYGGPLCASGHSWWLLWLPGRWVVHARQLRWVS